MRMLLLTGSLVALRYPEAVNRLASFCAQELREQGISRSLAVLPEDPEERVALFSFLMALKRAGAGPTAALIRSAALSMETLVACQGAGIDEIMVLQGVDDPGAAIAEMQRFRDQVPHGVIYRLWLESRAAGRLSRYATQWSQECPAPASVDPAPFSFDGPEAQSAPDTTPECEWRRRVITIDSGRFSLPCPAYGAFPGAERTKGKLMADVQPDSKCQSCRRLVRFAMPHWTMENDVGPLAMVVGEAREVSFEERLAMVKRVVGASGGDAA